ncbi:MAG TPA: ROK family transcriptional regulator [Streptomyces sp.]|nr:ROK family transcriptional regulator [Streptomyces sp.]
MTSESATTSGSELVVPYGTNAARVLGLLRSAGQEGASRNELAVRTGLTPQAVSKITARLRSHGLVTEAGRRASTGGKPSTVLRLAPGARHAVGIQIDRDQLMAVLVDLSGSVIAGRTASLDLGAGAEAVLDAVESAVHGLISAGLPSLGAGAGGAATSEGATGGELWQQAAAGEVWTGSPPAGGGVEEPARERAPGRERRQAVSEEGELWSDTGRDAEGEPEQKAEHEAELPEGEAEAEAAEAGAAAPSAAEAEAEAEAAEPPGMGGRWGSVVGVGVAAPGPLDHARGVLHHVTGFPRWAGYPLRDALARRLGMPVVLDKDTNAAALGLALRGRESLAYLHLGTGLGAGLVLDGRIHRGKRNGAGEFGHQVLQLDGPPCRCGKHGCAEALCLEAVRRGDTREAARVLGVGAANLVSLLDVDRVLLGGRTVLADPDAYVDGVTAQLRGTPAGVADGGARGPTGASGGGGVRVEVVPEGARTVADGAAQLVLGPLFGRVPGAVPAVPGRTV